MMVSMMMINSVNNISLHENPGENNFVFRLMIEREREKNEFDEQKRVYADDRIFFHIYY